MAPFLGDGEFTGTRVTFNTSGEMSGQMTDGDLVVGPGW